MLATAADRAAQLDEVKRKLLREQAERLEEGRLIRSAAEEEVRDFSVQGGGAYLRDKKGP